MYTSDFIEKGVKNIRIHNEHFGTGMQNKVNPFCNQQLLFITTETVLFESV